MTSEEFKQIHARIIAKAWSDSTFMDKLLKDPTTVCRAEGMVFDGEMIISTTEAGSNIFYLPPSPTNTSEFTVIELEKQASDMLTGDKEMF